MSSILCHFQHFDVQRLGYGIFTPKIGECGVATSTATRNLYSQQQMRTFRYLPLVALLGFSGHVLGDEHEEHPTIHGSGTTNPSPFFWKVMDLFEERARQDVRMTYRAVGSSTGQREFQGENNGNVAYTDFGTYFPGGRVMVHIPFVIGGVSIFYNIPTADLGGQPLDLDACTLAGIFNGNYTTWDNPAITTLNPSLTVPAGTPIKVFHRIKGSSSTSGVTQYLEQRTSAAGDSCPQLWSRGSGSKINWPTTYSIEEKEGGVGRMSGFSPRSGSGGMADGISSTPYSIGYIDSGFGHRLGLQEIKLKNRAGKFLDSKEADLGAAATAALAQTPAQGGLPANATQSFAQVSLLDKDGNTTWPITLMSYMYVEQNLTSKEQNGQLLKSFIEFVLSPTGQGIAEEFSFVRVPASIISYNNVTLNSLALASGTTPYFIEGSSTQVGTGAQEFVISQKRQSFADYDRNLIYSQLDALSARISTQEASSHIETLYGSGTTNPSRLFWKAMALMQDQASIPLHLSYRAVGSGTGISEFIGADNGNVSYTHFGSGDIPFNSEDYSSYTASGRQFVHIPFIVGAIGIFHSVPAADLGGHRLGLDPCSLAAVMSRRITTWDHPDILRQNPHLRVPANQPINVVRRVRGSSSTAGVTSYLQNVHLGAAGCPPWSLGFGRTITWPQGTIPAQGSGGIVFVLVNTPYSISYLDAGFGHDNNLEEISLKNRAGRFLTSKEADISAAGAQAAATIGQPGSIPSQPTSSWANVTLNDRDGQTTWPITAFSYFYVEKDLRRFNQTGEVLKAFIKFIMDHPSLASEFRFSKIPQSIYNYNIATLNSIQTSGTPFVFESSSTTQAGVGAGPYVISGKRRGYQDLALAAATSNITTLQSSVASLEASSAAGGCSCKDYDDSDVKAIANVAAVFGVLAFVISVIVAIKVFCCTPGHRGGAAKVERESNSISMGVMPASQMEIKLSEKV
eukprot:jgi/Bigna1/132573/aug1.18_g7281